MLRGQVGHGRTLSITMSPWIRGIMRSPLRSLVRKSFACACVGVLACDCMTNPRIMRTNMSHQSLEKRSPCRWVVLCKALSPIPQSTCGQEHQRRELVMELLRQMEAGLGMNVFARVY